MGKLTEQPLAELIREISIKGLSGTLRVEHERVQTAIYFDKGQLIYAASNLRTLRLREYLTSHGLLSGKQTAQLNNNQSDLDLAAALAAAGTLRQKDIDALLATLVSDVLRVSLLWLEGTWEFDPRARLVDPVRVEVETSTLLREAAQRMPINFVSGRFRNPGEVISRAAKVDRATKFQPTESFVLSRLDKPLSLEELVSLSGLREPEAQRVIYGLALADLVTREHWQNAFRTESPKPGREQPTAPITTAASSAQSEQSDNWISADIENEAVEEFLKRLATAISHYEVLELPTTAKLNEIKDTYYAMARRYHPDRFHLKSGTKLHAQISSAFARVTQAYETLANPNARAGYDQTLERARQFAQVEAKADKTSRAAESGEAFDDESADSETGVGRAQYCFKEGFGALEQGRINAAIKYLAQAARLAPQEAHYRAYYGRALAADPNTRRLAENEIQAAVRLQPANAAFRTMLAQLYFDLKFHRRAQTELDRALAIDPHHAPANLLLRKLEKSRKVG